MLRSGPVEFQHSERAQLDYLSDLYATITQIERLEIANNRDYLSVDEYKSFLTKYLQRYTQILDQVKSSHNPLFHGEEHFWESYCSKYSAAKLRIREGHPDQKEEKASSSISNSDVAFITQNFITLMDGISMKQSVAELVQLVSELLRSVRQAKGNDKDRLNEVVVSKVEPWSAQLQTMHPSDLLPERDYGQLLFDVQRAYDSFLDFIQHIAGSASGRK